MEPFHFFQLPFCNDATLGPPLLDATARCGFEPTSDGPPTSAASSVGGSAYGREVSSSLVGPEGDCLVLVRMLDWMRWADGEDPLVTEESSTRFRTSTVRAFQAATLTVVLVVASAPLSLPERATGQEATTEIVVTNNSDLSNGDTSSAPALIANPGPDGISLREAIEVTNNNPDTYTIRFDATLAGSTIELGSDLPPLLGGAVTIDGDVDGDGHPDVTLGGQDAQVGFSVSSSGNRLVSLELSDFEFGVVLQPPTNPIPTDQTFAGNEVSGLVMSGIGKVGVNLDPTALGTCGVPCNSNNTWLNTLVTDNTIESNAAGIFFWNSGVGEQVDNVMVTGNKVTITGNGQGSGIAFETAGPLGGAESTGARISNVRIEDNSVAGSPDIGITVAAGTGRAQEGVVANVKVLKNRLELSKTGNFYCCQGIVINAGSDVAEFAIGPPVRYLDDNIVRAVVVRDNTVSGTLEWGISVQAGWGSGGRQNRIRNVDIRRNVFRTSKPTLGAMVVNAGGTPYNERYATDNRIIGLTLVSNRFRIGTGSGSRLAGGGIGASGVALVGGHWYGRENVVRDVRIARNKIRTSYVGIRVIGGTGETASRNRVICVLRSGNRITDARKNLVVRANIDDATGNKVRLKRC